MLHLVLLVYITALTIYHIHSWEQFENTWLFVDYFFIILLGNKCLPLNAVSFLMLTLVLIWKLLNYSYWNKKSWCLYMLYLSNSTGVPSDPREWVLTPQIFNRHQFDSKDFRWTVNFSWNELYFSLKLVKSAQRQ